MKSPSIQSPGGFSLTGVVVGIAIFALMGASLSALTTMQSQFQQSVSVRTGAIAVHQNVMAAVGSDRAWARTRAATANGAVKCDAPPFQGPCASDPSQAETLRTPIELRDVGDRVLVPRADLFPNKGFTATGEPCDGWAPPPNGNDACPLRVTAFWRARCTVKDCTAAAFRAPEFVTVKFEYSPSGRTREPANLAGLGMPEQNRLSMSGGKAGSLHCAERGRLPEEVAFFISPGMGFNSAAADADGCVSYEAFIGKRGPQGPKGPSGPAGPLGPAGARGPDRSPCP